MSVKKLIAAATLPAMVATPVVAANPAASLSLRGEPSETAATADGQANVYPTAPAAEAAGMSPALLIGGLAVVLVVIGAVALGSGGGHHGSTPASA